MLRISANVLYFSGIYLAIFLLCFLLFLFSFGLGFALLLCFLLCFLFWTVALLKLIQTGREFVIVNHIVPVLGVSFLLLVLISVFLNNFIPLIWAALLPSLGLFFSLSLLIFVIFFPSSDIAFCSSVWFLVSCFHAALHLPPAISSAVSASPPAAHAVSSAT